MIASRASSAFVCFRCELHLARPQRDLFSRHSRAAFSTSVRRRNGDEASTGDPFPIQRPKLDDTLFRRDPPRKRKGRVQAITARLRDGVKTLGDDAQILVLRDEVEEATPPPKPKPETVISESSQDTLNLLDSLQDEAKPITLEDVARQLDGLRPKTDDGTDQPTYVTQKTFNLLSKKIAKSFTVTQLAQYYNEVKGVDQWQDIAKGELERSAWRPGTTSMEKRLPMLYGQKKRENYLYHKAGRVNHILRDVWKLVLLEEIEAPGELEVKLQPIQLALLQSGASLSQLDRIGRSRRAKIEVHPTHNVIRITADKTTAEYVLGDIEKLAATIEQRTFTIDEWIPYLRDYDKSKGVGECFPESHLQAISAMVAATLEIKTKNSILITAMNKEAAADAERCLLRLLPLQNRAAQSMYTSRGDAAGEQIFLLPVHYDNTAIDFHWRNEKLGRWTVPKYRRDLKDGTAETTTPGHDLDIIKARLLEMVEHAAPQPHHAFNEPDALWRHAPAVRASADLGYLLFRQDGSDLDKKPGEPGYEPQPFYTTIPGMTNILKDEDFQTWSRLHPPVLSYSFVAAPSQEGFQKGQTFPALQMQFEYNDYNDKHEFRRGSLLYNTLVHDVLLPEQSVDLRFTVSTSLTLRPKKDTENKNIAFFIEAILNNLKEGSKLTAPNLVLDIPAWTIPGSDPQARGTKKVEYLFTGVRFRQSVSANYLDSDVAIITEQGGKLGRKAAVLSSFFNTGPMGEPQKPELVMDDGLWTNFIARTLKIAHKITQAVRDTDILSYRLAKQSSRAAHDLAFPDRHQTERNRAKNRDPNSARAVRRREAFGDSATAAAVDAATNVEGEDALDDSSKHADLDVVSNVLTDDAAVPPPDSKEHQIPSELTDSEFTDEVVVPTDSSNEVDEVVERSQKDGDEDPSKSAA